MPESPAGEPWFSVGRAVEALGGERVDGWILEEWRGLALRARFSACWRDPRGNLWNVLPQAGAIAFLADPQRRYEGVPLADQYQALSRDVPLEDYLTCGANRPAPAWTTRPASAWPGWPRAWKAGWPWAAVATRLVRAAAASATATAAPAWWPRPPERRCAVRRATARRVSACRRSPGPRLAAQCRLERLGRVVLLFVGEIEGTEVDGHAGLRLQRAMGLHRVVGIHVVVAHEPARLVGADRQGGETHAPKRWLISPNSGPPGIAGKQQRAIRRVDDEAEPERGWCRCGCATTSAAPVRHAASGQRPAARPATSRSPRRRRNLSGGSARRCPGR